MTRSKQRSALLLATLLVYAAATSLFWVGPVAIEHAAASTQALSTLALDGGQVGAACPTGDEHFEAGATGAGKGDDSWTDFDNSVIAMPPIAFHWLKGRTESNQFHQLWGASCWNDRVPKYIDVHLALIYNDEPEPRPPLGRTFHTVRVTLSPVQGLPPSNPPFVYGGLLVVRRDGRRIPRKEHIAYTVASVFIQYEWTWRDLPFLIGEQRFIQVHRNWNIVAQDPPPKVGEEIPKLPRPKPPRHT